MRRSPLDLLYHGVDHLACGGWPKARHYPSHDGGDAGCLHRRSTCNSGRRPVTCIVSGAVTWIVESKAPPSTLAEGRMHPSTQGCMAGWKRLRSASL